MFVFLQETTPTSQPPQIILPQPQQSRSSPRLSLKIAPKTTTKDRTSQPPKKSNKTKKTSNMSSDVSTFTFEIDLFYIYFVHFIYSWFWLLQPQGKPSSPKSCWGKSGDAEAQNSTGEVNNRETIIKTPIELAVNGVFKVSLFKYKFIYY